MSASHNERRQAGFIMLEMLAAIILAAIVLTALATVTAQWMPSWNRGMRQVQQIERLGIGLDRIVSDLAAIQHIPITNAVAFDGRPDSITFVRSAIGPAARPGLEFVRLSQTRGEAGSALVRERSAYVPISGVSQLRFGDPVTLIQSPYQVSFSYGDARQGWRADWHDATALPKVVRISVREIQTDRVIVASTVAVVAVDASPECVRAKSIAQCLSGRGEQPEQEL